MDLGLNLEHVADALQAVVDRAGGVERVRPAQVGEELDDRVLARQRRVDGGLLRRGVGAVSASREIEAATPLTFTSDTVRPRKSRLNSDRSCVALDSIDRKSVV